MDDIEDIGPTLKRVRELARHLPREPKRLPDTPKGAWAAPTPVLRSALFGMVERGKRKHVESEPVTCWKGDQICYTGWYLDQADLDCWLAILDIAKEQDLGEVVYLRARELLRHLGRSSSGNSHKWLRRSVKRLRSGTVEITSDNGGYYQGGLVFSLRFDPEDKHYEIRLDLEIASLFDDAFVRLNCEKRKQLSSDLAKWLQGYVTSNQATVSKPHRIGIAKLRGLCRSQTAELWKFKQQLKRALGELQAAGVIRSFELPPRGTVVEWTRPEQVSKTAKQRVESAK